MTRCHCGPVTKLVLALHVNLHVLFQALAVAVRGHILRNPQMALNMKDLYGNSGNRFKKINCFVLAFRAVFPIGCDLSDLPFDHLCSPSSTFIHLHSVLMNFCFSLACSRRYSPYSTFTNDLHCSFLPLSSSLISFIFIYLY